MLLSATAPPMQGEPLCKSNQTAKFPQLWLKGPCDNDYDDEDPGGGRTEANENGDERE